MTKTRYNVPLWKKLPRYKLPEYMEETTAVQTTEHRIIYNIKNKFKNNPLPRAYAMHNNTNTNEMDKETIYGQIVSKANNYVAVPDKSGGKRIIKSDHIRNYEKSFLNQCLTYRNRLISRPFILHVDVYESNNSYDLDNALKTLLDCLQYAKAISNDNLCIGIQAHKHIDKVTPRIVYGIEETEPRLF